MRRNSIVNIQQGYSILADYCTDILAYSTPDVNFTGYRDSSSCKTAVYIAGNKAKLCLECRPAFCSQSHIFSGAFVSLYPIQQSNFILSQFRQDFRFHIAFAQLFLHILCHLRNTWVSFMVFKGLEKVQLRVFFNLDSQVIQSLDRSIAGQEVLRTRTEADNFQVFQSHNSSCDGNKFFNHTCHFFSCANRIFRNIGF